MNGPQGLVLGLVAGATLGAVGAAVWAGARAATLTLGSAGPAAAAGTGTGPATPTAPTPAATTAPAAVSVDPAAMAAVQAKLTAAEARVAALEGEKTALAIQVQSLEAKVAGGDEPTGPRARLRFGVPEKAPAFDKADWPKLASHMVALGKALPAYFGALMEGRQPDGATTAAVQTNNMPLALFAIAAAEELGGTGPNGAYTHPAVIANLVRAALAAANDPLTPAQETAIAALGEAWAGEVQRTAAAYAPSTLALQKTVDEVDQKLRFLAALRGSLSPAQQAVCFPPETTGRIGMDLLSPGLVYIGLTRPAEGIDRASVERALVRHLLELAGETDVAAVERYAWVGRAWVDAVPGALIPRAPRAPELMSPHVDALQAAARAQVAATERLLALGELAADRGAALRANTAVLVPYVVVVPPTPAGG